MFGQWLSKMTVGCSIVLFATICAVSGVELPSYMHRCSISDPHVSECVLTSANIAIPNIVNGVEELKIPNLRPLEVEKIVAQQGPNFKITLSDVKVYGIDNTTIKDAQLDFDKRIWRLKVSIPKYTIIADYSIEGRILFLPIQGSGTCNVTVAGAVFDYMVKYDLKPRKSTGKTHMHITESNVAVTVTRSYVEFDNLFNGDQRLGEEMNKFLDENWKEFFEEMRPTVSETTGTVVTTILNAVNSAIAYEDYFLP